MSFSILFQQSFEVYRPNGGGKVSPTGDWIPATSATPILMKGNIEPYTSTDISKGHEAIPFRDGYDSSSAKKVFTDQLVYGVSRKSNREPDYMIIDGLEYVCWSVFDNMNTPLTTLRHCECIFVERDGLENS